MAAQFGESGSSQARPVVGLALGALILLALAIASPARAVPAFAQQTGQPCSSCHVGAFGPQLKPYARDFKLFGYQATDGKSHEPPIAVTMLDSFTHTQQSQYPSAAPHFAANDNVAVDQVSVYYAGKAPGGLGVFSQVTYDGVAEAFNLDNTDIRKVAALEIGDKDLALGVDFNNAPGVQDAWNSTPTWGFPYNGSPLAPAPAAGTLIDGGLQHQVAGVGAYLYYDYSIYAELTAYLPVNRVLAGRLGEGTNSSSDRFTGLIPYWRLALNRDFGTKASAEIGTYGLSAQRDPGGIAGFGTDRLTDWAVDANYYNQALKKQVVSLHATWIHEDQSLNASAAINGTNPHDTLNTLRADLSWSFHDTWTPTVQLFRTYGSADPMQYGGQNGSPDSQGYVVELAYTGLGRPDSFIGWANWRAAIQYVGYQQFDGTRQGASGNNTLYLSLWLAVAPFGGLVQR